MSAWGAPKGFKWAVALFHVTCAALLVINYAIQFQLCEEQRISNVHYFKARDSPALYKRPFFPIDSLTALTCFEAIILLNLAFLQKDSNINRNTSKLLVIFTFILIKVRRAGFFGLCFDNDKCCNEQCDKFNELSFRINEITCNVNAMPVNSQSYSWADTKNYCPVPSYFFHCREQAHQTNLMKMSDNSHCLSWGCMKSISPIPFIMKWCTAINVIVAIVFL